MGRTSLKQYLLNRTGLLHLGPHSRGCLYKIKTVSITAQRDMKAHELQPLAEELLTVNRFYGRECRIFPSVVSGMLIQFRLPHTHEYIIFINWTQWVIEKSRVKIRSWMGMGGRERELGGVKGSKYDQNSVFMHKILKKSNKDILFEWKKITVLKV